MEAEQFGQYRLEELIGRGGMGEVYRAFDTVRERTVALKRLPAHLAADAEFQARFRKESALASRLFEPHIIPIHDFGEIDGRLFIDMRLVDGRDLGTVLAKEGPMAPERAVAVVSQVASALAAAHADGLVHRDVKPSNVLLTGETGEFAYLVDFGIARSVGAGGEPPLTVTGATVGTLDYMAPERFLGNVCDHRVDVYSLACLLFEALTGRKPFRGDGPPAMIHAHLNMEPPSPSRERPSVPASLDRVVATGMAKRPEDRYPTARALADAALAALRSPSPATQVAGRPPGPAAAPPMPWLPPAMSERGPSSVPGSGPQAPPWPVARTLVGMPNAGFSVPGAPGEPTGPGGPPGSPPSRRWPLVAVAAGIVALVVIGIAVAVPVIVSNASGPGPSTTTAPPVPPSTTTPPPTTTVPPADEFPQPASLPGGDPVADKALWDTLQGQGVIWKGCQYTESAVPATLSYLLCEASSPALDLRLGFESYASADEVRTEIDNYTNTLAGNPGSCDAGGKFSGMLLGREVSCGYFTFEDGTSAYYIVWAEPSQTVMVTAADADPSRTWQWFQAHDPT